MLPVKTLPSKFLLTTIIVLSIGQATAQNVAEFYSVGIDTSDYIPYYYDGALDYNLMIAASKGYDTEIVRLVRNGADINAASGEGATPLVFAVDNRWLTTVKTLISLGANVNKITGAGESVLHIAVKNDNPEIAEALIRAGADMNIRDRSGATPLHYAAIYGYFSLVDLLLYYEAEIDQKALDGTTPLMAAIWAGNADITDLLIQNGANLEARDKEQFTPFLIAAQNGDTLIMNLLLKEGIDLYEKNNRNYNALDLAIVSDFKPAIELLLEKGNKWNSSDSVGLNPYEVARAFSRKDIIDLLNKDKVPGEPKRRFDEISVNATTKFNVRDIFTGISISVKEPLLNIGFNVGFDSKPWYTKVLLKTGENEFYQFMDKSSIFHAGVFKDFTVKENNTGMKAQISASISGAYTFGNKLKGTTTAPEARFRPIPSVIFKAQKNHLRLDAGFEYMKSPFYKAGPLWVRAGISYNFYLSKVRAAGKVIKWY